MSSLEFDALSTLGFDITWNSRIARHSSVSQGFQTTCAWQNWRLLYWLDDNLMFEKKTISKTRASCFIRVPKHLKTIKASFLVFGNPDETLALVFEISIESFKIPLS